MICSSLPRPVFEVAQQSDFLEHVPLQVVRLVHDQHRGAADAGPLQQHVVQGEQDFGLGEAVAPQIQIVGQHLEELLHGQTRIEQGGEGDLLRVEKVAQALQHGGLAGADLAGEDDEALAALHAIDQVGQRFFVLRAPEQERRVRAHVERILVKPKKALYIVSGCSEGLLAS